MRVAFSDATYKVRPFNAIPVGPSASLFGAAKPDGRTSSRVLRAPVESMIEIRPEFRVELERLQECHQRFFVSHRKPQAELVSLHGLCFDAIR
jgi:hypothetical protein